MDAIRVSAVAGFGVAAYVGETRMNVFVNRAKDFLKSEDGPTATEYAVMLALIIVACIGAITALGGSVSSMFEGLSGTLDTVPTS